MSCELDGVEEISSGGGGGVERVLHDTVGVMNSWTAGQIDVGVRWRTHAHSLGSGIAKPRDIFFRRLGSRILPTDQLVF